LAAVPWVHLTRIALFGKGRYFDLYLTAYNAVR
jgi:hypothetical protein